MVELLVIAPIALLVIAGFVALMVTMVGDVIANRTYNVVTYDVQSALSTIEQDVKLSTQFLADSGTMLSPQGKNGASSAFTSIAGDLILGSIATDKNPIDPTRGFIYYNSPFSCSDPSQVYKNRIFFTTVIYFVNNGSLWRRTYVPTASDLCQSPWQVNTCAPGFTDTRCKANDSEILKGISNFTVNYYLNPQDTIALSAGAASSASAIGVSLQSQVSAAGRTVSSTSSIRSTKLSARDINIAPPAAPSVSGTATDSEVSFYWPGVPTATSYLVRYNINGNSWITASENTTNTTFSIAAARGDTVSVKVFARNTTGASADVSSNNASVTIPVWTACNLENSWANYNNGYDTCGFTITKHGVVVLKGVISGGSITSGTVLFRLPSGYRPAHRLFFMVIIASNKYARIIVDTNGEVQVATTETSANNGWMTLSGARFIPSGSLYKWSALTPTSPWTNLGGSHPPLQSTTDDSGRVHIQGLLNRNTAGVSSDFTTIPSGNAPSKIHHFPGFADNGYDRVGMRPDGTMMAAGNTNTWYSVETMHYPASYSSGNWQSFTTTAGNPNDNQLGNGWVYYDNNGSVNATPQFTKGADGIVTLKGIIKNGTTTSGTYIGKLPAGYRPLVREMFALTSGSTSPHGLARIDVDSNGYIIARLVNSTWTSLDGIHFLAAQ